MVATSENTALLPLVESSTEQARGSSLPGCVFNLTNSIVGAGCIGLGGAIASSGGIVSIVAMLSFATLCKLSFDILIELSEGGSYEQLAAQTYGRAGTIAVVISRFLYAFGCLVAYVKIVKDNFASAVGSISGVQGLNDDVITLLLSALVMFPLCLLRDMTPLERVSIVKIAIVFAILGTVLYLYPANHVSDGSFLEHWLEVRPGIVNSLGTFLFTFVAQHIVHLTYESIRPDIRTVTNWKVVSTYSILLSTVLSLGIGMSVYITFWEKGSSAMFELYSSSIPLSVAKLLLSCMMMLTYPLPFLTCREMMVMSIPSSKDVSDCWWLVEPKQLILPFHVLMTLSLWGISTILALLAPSLGDVLDLVGCATGTMIAFILPAMFSFRIKGYTHLAGLIFAVGGTVGIVGTLQTLRNLL